MIKLSKQGLYQIAFASLAASVLAGLAVFVSVMSVFPGNREVFSVLAAVFTEFLFIVFSFVLYRIFASQQAWKINELNRMFTAISRGDYPSPDPVEDNDPLAEIKTSAGIIAEKLKSYDRRFNEKLGEETGNIKHKAELVSVQNRLLQENRIELEKYRLAVAQAPVHIIITDPDGKILYANKAATKITGYPAGEMIGQTPKLWGRQMPPEYYSRMWKTLKEEKTYFTGEIRNRRKNGQIYEAEIRVEPILNHENEIMFFVGIEEDITHRKEVDRMKTEFISLASHQLRTPLTVIRWLLEQVFEEEKESLPESAKNHLERVYEATLRMVRLVKTLLDISRIESGRILLQPQKIDTGKLIGEAVSLNKPITDKKGQTVTVRIEENLPEITTDYELLLNAVSNLLSNAAKYSPAQGEITMAAFRENGVLVIEVKDNGIGIPESDQPRIYERFFRAGNAASGPEEGTGLGLYLVQKITALLGGQISFSSRENGGTSFRISFPVSV